ncbi:Chromosomal replication initiator protein DnaA [compost metagenome]
MDLLELWKVIMYRIKSEVNPNIFEVWFKNTELKEKNDDKLIVYAPNEFVVEWLNKHYRTLLENVASEIQGKKTMVSFTSVNNKETSALIKSLL